MEKTLVLSDAHLKPSDPEGVRRLCHFLEREGAGADTLVVLGDLFDFWFEWRGVIPALGVPVHLCLRGLVEQGVRVVMVPGNHDFALGSFWREETGAEVVQGEELVLDASAGRVLLAHGDGWAAPDRSYRALRRVLRSSWAQWAFGRLVHPEWSLGLADWTSRKSRHLMRRQPDLWRAWYLQAAAARMVEGVGLVILGHTHDPGLFPLPRGLYANCGDWVDHRSSLWLEGDRVRLCDNGVLVDEQIWGQGKKTAGRDMEEA